MGTTTDRVLGQNNSYNAVFTDKKDNSMMDHMDFLKLMVAQMQNQDFTNPMDNSQMFSQMTQFSNMQMMQEMASYSKSNYAMSLVGKTVTASRFTVSGELDTTTGRVDKVSLVDNEYVIFVGSKKYTLEQIMAIESGGSSSGATTVDPTKYPLGMTDITYESATVNWKVPTEDETAAKDLKYTVYYSTTDGEFDTVEKVEKGTKVGKSGEKDITSKEIIPLDPETKYYVNVVVTDANGNKTVYKPVSFKTKS